MDRISDSVLEKASERGTAVHSYCASIANREFLPPLPNEYQGYIISFKNWYSAYVDKPIYIEKEFEDHELGYCGHPDMVVKSIKLGGNILVDFKTPVTLKRKIWGAQLCAYERLVPCKVHRMGSLRLDKDGGIAKFDDFTGARTTHFAAFYAALQAYKYFF